ncbi:proteoglycan 4-like [Vigna umbellata]|uniref:proteoglycan 4-like n=1 Tax=Vigna umbellata TaxID=87088 RepID=UPI001F5E4E97|nr:proteoglycan 4-like [Vigna umbellata]
MPSLSPLSFFNASFSLSLSSSSHLNITTQEPSPTAAKRHKFNTTQLSQHTDMDKPQTLLSPNATNCNSPEFEFWMLRNPSFPQPHLLSADELFVDGVLLPLHLLPNKPHPSPKASTFTPPIHEPDPEPGSPPDPEPSPSILTEPTTSSSASKRWRDIFRKTDKKNTENTEDKEKGKKRERKSGTSASSAELNINIWPFSRSRSAGNAGTRPKLFAGAPLTRKVNSAPCSRSNSAGESKSRKWPSSPGRAGVHVGRSSPVWQVRRKTSDPPKSRRSKVTGGGGTARVLNLNVPMCIGYRHHLSCRSDENSAVGVSGGGILTSGNSSTTTNNNNTHNSNSGGNDGGSGGNIFNLRNLFTKKCVVTSH